MYNLQKRINNGIEVSLDDLLLRQNKEWLRVCNSAIKLKVNFDMDEFILSKRKVLEFLMREFPHLVTLLTQTSGSIELSARRLNFVSVLYYGDAGCFPSGLLSLITLLDSLELFDCCQKVCNSFRKKSGVGKFNFKLVLSPVFRSKFYDGDVETLIRVLLGESFSIDFTLGSELLRVLKTNADIPEDSDILLKKVDNPYFSAEYLDLILEFAEKDGTCEYIHPSVLNLIKMYNEASIEERIGRVETYFPSYKDNFFQQHTGVVFSKVRALKQGSIWDLNSDNLIFVSPTCMYMTGEGFAIDYDFHYISPFCVNLEGERLFSLNHQLGYVGVYVDLSTLVQNRWTSDYNPVTMYKLDNSTGRIKPVQMYLKSWVRPVDDLDADTSVLGLSVCDYLDYPFSLSNLVSDEGSDMTVETYLESFDKYVLGSETYKVSVRNTLGVMLRVLLDTELCFSAHTLDSFNSLNSEEIELLSDVDGLLSVVLD